MTAELDGEPIAVGGDVITAIDGKRVRTSQDVAAAVTGRRAGDRVKVELLRDGKKRTVEVRLDQRPASGLGAAAALAQLRSGRGRRAPLQDLRPHRRSTTRGWPSRSAPGRSGSSSGRARERRCEPAEAQRIARTLRRQAEVCGVFVNAPLDEVAGLADGIGLTMVQLHGDEGPAYCAEVARRTGAKVMKAVRVRTGADVEASRASTPTSTCSTRSTPSAGGGTGESFDWTLAARRRTPRAARPQRRADARRTSSRRSARSGRSPSTWPAAPRRRPGSRIPSELRAFAAAVRSTAAEPVA